MALKLLVPMLKTLRNYISHDWGYIKLGIKASIAPGALMCLVVSDAWLNHFHTTAYLAPVIGAASLPTLPRAKLIWLHFQLASTVACSYAYCLLAGWCGLQARLKTTGPSVVTDAYNGSAEAVIAIFFCFYFWLVFTLKSAHQVWQVPCVLAGLYTAAVVPPLAKATSFEQVKGVASISVEAYFAGQAFALVVGLCIFPLSCRTSFFLTTRASILQIIALTKIHSKLMDSLICTGAGIWSLGEEAAQVQRLKSSLQRFLSLTIQAKSDLNYAKQELAWARFDGSLLEGLHTRIANLTPLLSGMVSTTDMLHTARERDFSSQDSGQQGSSQWQEMCVKVHGQSKALSESAAHSATEALQLLDLATERQHVGRGVEAEKREELSEDAPTTESSSEHDDIASEFIRGRTVLRDLHTPQQHIKSVHYFMILSERKVLALTASEMKSLLDFLQAANVLPLRIVTPNPRIIAAHFWSLFSPNPAPATVEHEPIDNGQPLARVRNAGWSTVQRSLHLVSNKHAGFGLRGACAMLSVGIVAFLPSSAAFYSTQRFLWALSAIVISLNDTAGSSTQSLCFRFAGTMTSMLASYVIWYVPDQKTPGILVLLWLWFAILGYFYAKWPKIQASWFVALIAAIGMVGNELQVRLLGVSTVESLGQTVYKPFVLFPYRMAIVLLGILVAYFWTLFPFPTTAHHQLRRGVSDALLSLAKYHLAVQETTRDRFLRKRSLADGGLSPSVAEARRLHFAELQRLNGNAEQLIKFLSWELRLGPIFPEDTAAKILVLSAQLANHMSLIGSVSMAISSVDDQRPASTVQHEGTLLKPHLCPEGITSRLVSISNALADSRGLAPDMTMLEVPDMTYFLHAECSADSRFVTAALVHATNYYMIQDVLELQRLAVSVVGVLDFRTDGQV